MDSIVSKKLSLLPEAKNQVLEWANGVMPKPED